MRHDHTMEEEKKLRRKERKDYKKMAAGNVSDFLSSGEEGLGKEVDDVDDHSGVESPTEEEIQMMEEELESARVTEERLGSESFDPQFRREEPEKRRETCYSSFVAWNARSGR